MKHNVQNYRLLLVLSLIVSVAAQATQIRLLNLEEMVEQSDRIIVGTVKSIDPEKSTTPQKSLPVVRVSLDLSETLKGGHHTKTVIRTHAPNIPLRMKLFLHSPQFKIGEEVVIFLDKPTIDGLAGPLAFEQGVFRVASNKSSRKMVTNRLEEGRLFLNFKSKSMRTYVEQKKLHVKTRQHDLTLEEFKSTIKKIHQEKK